MAKIEDQRILVWCNQPGNLYQTITEAAYLAVKLEKELCLFVNYVDENQRIQLDERISVMSLQIIKEVQNIEVSKLIIKGSLHDLISELGEKYNAILLCFSSNMTYKILKAFYKSSFPFYFSKGNLNKTPSFRNVIIPVDFRSSTKDAVLWGSYLGRFTNSEPVLLKANDKNDQEQKRKVENTIESAQKLYNQFNFKYTIEEAKVGSWRIHGEARALSATADLLIFAGSLNVTWLDYINGPFERRIINQNLSPVLLINPQKEMYLICS